MELSESVVNMLWGDGQALPNLHEVVYVRVFNYRGPQLFSAGSSKPQSRVTH